jgi:hypothetical protein
MECILDKRVSKKTRRKQYLSIWSSGRIIQLNMPAGRMKRRYRGMDRPCRSSWTGAHENFQAREYDAGASSTHQASQRRSGGQLDKPTQILKFPLKLLHDIK